MATLDLRTPFWRRLSRDSQPSGRCQRFVHASASLSTLALSLACTPPPDRRAVVTTDSAGVQILTIRQDTADVPRWRLTGRPDLVLTGTESGDSAALALAGAVRWLSNGSLVVADLGASRLLVYDSSGRFRTALGRRGSGPGELRDITSVTARGGDTVVTFDGALRRLTSWNAVSGTSEQLALGNEGALDAWPAQAWHWGDSTVLVLQLAVTPKPAIPAARAVVRWPMAAQLTVRGRTGKLQATGPTFEGTYTGLFGDGDTRIPFAPQAFATLARDRVYFGSGAAFEVWSAGADLAPNRVIRWPARDEPLGPDEVQRVRDETYRLLTERMPPDRATAAIARNFVPEIQPDRRPAFGRVFVDDDGRLWLERFEAVRLGSRLQRPGAQWTVLAPDGAPVAILDLPADVRLEAVRGDLAAVVLRDSLDVQSVEVFRIVR